MRTRGRRKRWRISFRYSLRQYSGGPAHARDPAVQYDGDGDERDATDPDRRRGKGVTDEGQRRGIARKRNDGRNDHAKQALADDQARRQQNAELLDRVAVRATFGATVEPGSDQGTDHNHQRRRRRQVDAQAHGQWRQTWTGLHHAEDLIENDDRHADTGTDGDQAPVDVVRDHALRQRRDQAGLRGGQRTRGIGARSAEEPVGVLQQVQHRRNHHGASNDADDQRP